MGGHKTISASSYLLSEECMFVKRTPQVANDLIETDLTLDGAYHDWDMSSIIPINTQAVLIQLNLQALVSNGFFLFREKGIGAVVNVSQAQTAVAGVLVREMLVAVPSQGRILEYLGKNTTWTSITIFVMGWWI